MKNQLNKLIACLSILLLSLVSLGAFAQETDRVMHKQDPTESKKIVAMYLESNPDGPLVKLYKTYPNDPGLVAAMEKQLKLYHANDETPMSDKQITALKEEAMALEKQMPYLERLMAKGYSFEKARMQAASEIENKSLIEQQNQDPTPRLIVAPN